MAGEGRIFRRRVFYIPGFDPFHPRRYRELYRKEGAEQARLMGYGLQMQGLREKNRYAWHVRAEIEGQSAESEIEVLPWADIVRQSMSGTILATYGQLARTAWIYFASGSLWRMAKLRKGPIIAALYPAVFLLLQLGLALGLGGLIGWGIARYSHWALGLLAGLTLGYGLLRWFKAKDHKIFAWYLIHDYAFTARLKGEYPPELEARLAEFAAKIRTALAQDYDEVLLVGHSSGAHLAVSVLADLLRAGQGDGRLALLTLGQAVPMAAFLPRAARLRGDLAYLSEMDLFWLDVSAPGDGCSFALCDPVAVTGVAGAGQKYPLVISAAFRQTLSPQTQKQLKRRWFRLHFQYLCAFDRLAGRSDDYDYFRITAGGQSLRARMGGRKPSASRITRAVNKYTSCA